MSKKALSARASAESHIRAALETGVRGDLRDLLKKALMAAAGQRVTELTDMDYRKLADGAKLADPNRPGLVMRKGARSGARWIYRFKEPGTSRQVELQFGRYPELGLGNAREAWRILRDQRACGKMPQLANAVDAAAPVRTVGWLVSKFLSEYAAKVKRPSSTREDTRMLNRHVIPHYADTPVNQFDTAAVAAILAPLHKTAPREAEKVRAVLSTMFNVACGRTRKISTLGGSWLPPDMRNPVIGAQLPLRKPRSHNPSAQELKAYVRGLDGIGNYGDVLRLQLETFARISEVSGLPWAEIDLECGVWSLPADRAKNGRSHRVMLAASTLEWLNERAAFSQSSWVFPAAKDPGLPVSVSVVQHALAGNRAAMGLAEGFTSHAVRHAGMTWVAEQGGGRDIRDRLSNHAPPRGGADHIYVAAQLDKPAREWTQMWVDHLTGLVSENVVSLGREVVN